MCVCVHFLVYFFSCLWPLKLGQNKEKQKTKKNFGYLIVCVSCFKMYLHDDMIVFSTVVMQFQLLQDSFFFLKSFDD